MQRASKEIFERAGIGAGSVYYSAGEMPWPAVSLPASKSQTTVLQVSLLPRYCMLHAVQ